MNASAAQVRAAVDAGATLSTHLGNGADPILPRHPNYIWDQLAEDRLTATLIADGHHLPSAVVKSFVRAKTPERIVLVSDLSGMAGLPAGEYSTDFCRIEILADGRIVVAGQRQMLAGAARPIAAGIANAMRFAGVDLAAAVDMATSAAAGDRAAERQIDRGPAGGRRAAAAPAGPRRIALRSHDRADHRRGPGRVRATRGGVRSTRKMTPA